MAFLDRSIATGNDTSVRRVLTPLAQLAETYDSVFALIRHLNKNANKRGLYRGAGSMAFLAACRSAWLFAPHPGKPAHAVMAQVKNNLAPSQPSLSYGLVNREGAPPASSLTGPCELTTPDLLKWADRAYPALPPPREFLLTLLRDGPQPVSLVWPEALKLGLSRKTVDRARRDAEIRTYRIIRDGRNLYFWLLKEHAPPQSSDPDIRAFEEKLEKMCARTAAPQPARSTS